LDQEKVPEMLKTYQKVKAQQYLANLKGPVIYNVFNIFCSS
jgi:hypothetical protein